MSWWNRWPLSFVDACLKCQSNFAFLKIEFYLIKRLFFFSETKLYIFSHKIFKKDSAFILQALIALKKGAQLLKYGRKGKPKFCPFRLSNVSLLFNMYTFGLSGEEWRLDLLLLPATCLYSFCFLYCIMFDSWPTLDMLFCRMRPLWYGSQTVEKNVWSYLLYLRLFLAKEL